jgi:hypothetical protein
MVSSMMKRSLVFICSALILVAGHISSAFGKTCDLGCSELLYAPGIASDPSKATPAIASSMQVFKRRRDAKDKVPLQVRREMQELAKIGRFQLILSDSRRVDALEPHLTIPAYLVPTSIGGMCFRVLAEGATSQCARGLQERLATWVIELHPCNAAASIMVVIVADGVRTVKVRIGSQWYRATVRQDVAIVRPGNVRKIADFKTIELRLRRGRTIVLGI